jgi:tricarballylate dehydrogenase
MNSMAGVNDAPFDPSKHDGKCTRGISPAKSNWAQRLDMPPFYAFPVTCGITFTFGGVGITEKCEVKDTSGNLISGLFAAGEITGGSFFNNYPGGSGLMKGAVFGRLAGTHAAELCQGEPRIKFHRVCGTRPRKILLFPPLPKGIQEIFFAP